LIFAITRGIRTNSLSHDGSEMGKFVYHTHARLGRKEGVQSTYTTINHLPIQISFFILRKGRGKKEERKKTAIPARFHRDSVGVIKTNSLAHTPSIHLDNRQSNMGIRYMYSKCGSTAPAYNPLITSQ
jgi:hypothetical protein